MMNDGRLWMIVFGWSSLIVVFVALYPQCRLAGGATGRMLIAIDQAARPPIEGVAMKN